MTTVEVQFGRAPIRRLFSVVNGATPDSQNKEYWDGDIPWVTPEDLSNRVSIEISETKRSITTSGYDACGTTLVPAGSIVLSTRAPIGNIAIAGRPVCTNQGCRSLVPLAKLSSRFFFYQLSVLTDELNRLGRGTTFLELSSNELAALKLYAPGWADQSRIANFLDEQTARIDALIAEKERLDALLGEYRQSVIMQAVTKGLNPDVPMKDSGVEWLGDVPEHWTVGALRWRAKCASGVALAPESIEVEAKYEWTIPVIGGNGLMGYTRTSFIDHSVLAIGRVGALCGNVHVVSGPAWITDNALVVRTNPRELVVAYLHLVLIARNLNEIASKTAQPLITGTQVLDQRVPIPPVLEQNAIVSFATAATARIHALAEESCRSITSLREYRASLISAAVTGQLNIDNFGRSSA